MLRVVSMFPYPGNHIGPEGALALAGALKINQSVHTIDLSGVIINFVFCICIILYLYFVLWLLFCILYFVFVICILCLGSNIAFNFQSCRIRSIFLMFWVCFWHVVFSKVATLQWQCPPILFWTSNGNVAGGDNIIELGSRRSKNSEADNRTLEAYRVRPPPISRWGMAKWFA